MIAHSKPVTPAPAPRWDGGKWAQVCQALRGLMKDYCHYSHESAAGEAEAFEKLANVRFTTTIDGEAVQVRVIIRSSEQAIADGFVLAWRETLIEAPDQDATYLELWDWAQSREDLLFLPFDVKTLSLGAGGVGTESHYYTWTTPELRKERAQSEYVQFVLAMIEGVDNHMAIIPAETWKKAREYSFENETLVHGIPLWIALGMVADNDLEAAFTSMIQMMVNETGWYTNPSNKTIFEGWQLHPSEHARYKPDNITSTSGISSEVVGRLWSEVSKLGGRIYFNPFAPLLVDFVIWLPDTGFIWIEHKYHNVKLKSFSFDTNQRRTPFDIRRVWHYAYCQAQDGVICVPRDEVDYSWGRSHKLPPEAIARFRCNDFSSALEKIIKPHLEKARHAVAQAMADLKPADITAGLPTDGASQKLRETSTRSSDDNPMNGLLIRLRTAPGVSSVLNRWCRTKGEGVCLALGGGNRFGTHILVDYTWTPEDQSTFDEYGELPLHWLSPDLESRTHTPIWMEDHSMPNTEGKWSFYFPFANRKENHKMIVGTPRGVMVGLLTQRKYLQDLAERSSWYLFLPLGLTARYKHDHFAQKSDILERTSGGQVFHYTTVDKTLIPEPKHPLNQSTIVFSEKYLIDKDITLGRYVLNLLDGTIYRELMKILKSDGMVSVSNPLLRSTESRQFDAREYQGLIRDLMQGIWEYGYLRQENVKSRK